MAALSRSSNTRRSRRNRRRVRLRLPAVVPPETTDAVIKGSRLRTVPASKKNKVIEFVFPFTPISITYDSLAPEWTVINRPLNTPIIDLRTYSLMRVELRFLLAVPLDGIRVSVDNDIRTLRSIANSQDPVAFINMDRMLTNPFNIPRLGQRRTNQGFFFRIGDMSVESVRRNMQNEITSAEISITLQEEANPPIRKIYFQPVVYSKLSKPSTIRSKTSAPSGSTISNNQLQIDLNTARARAISNRALRLT